MPRLTPYLLLGALGVATGLGVGLGLSEAPVAQAAGPLATVSVGDTAGSCTVLYAAGRSGVGCTSPGSGISGSLGFKTSTEISSQLARCLAKVQRTEAVPRGPAGFKRAFAVLRARAASMCPDHR